MNISLLSMLESGSSYLLIGVAPLVGYSALRAWRTWSDDTQPLVCVLSLASVAYVFRLLASIGGWIQVLLPLLAGVLIWLLAKSLAEEEEFNEKET